MNGLTSPKAGVADWPPGPAPRAARGAPQPSDAFAGILDSQQARTATAEGHERSPKATGRDRRESGPVANERAEARSNAEWARERRAADGVERERPVQHHGDDTQAPLTPPAEGSTPADVDVPAEGPEQPAVAADAQPVQEPVVVPVAVLTMPPVAPVQTEPAQVAAASVAQPQSAPAPAAAAIAAVLGEQPAVEAQAGPVAAVQQAAAATAQASDGVPPEVLAKASQQDPAAKPQAADRAADPAQPAIARATPGQPGATGSGSGSNAGDTGPKHDQQPGALPQQAAEQARTVAQAYGRAATAHAEAPAQPGQPAVTPAAGPAAPAQQPAAGANPATRATPVPLARAAENVEHVLRLASARGVTHARIALNPVELGSIDVHMRHTSEGIVATVVAHAPDAVQQLQNAAQDLRRSLEQQGLNLLSLDIGQRGDERSAGRAGSDGGDHGRGQHAGADAAGPGATGTEAEIVTTNLQLPNGVLVDVLA